MADQILGVKAFSLYTKKKNRYTWNNSPSKVVYDPLLIALSDYIGNTEDQKILKDDKIKVKEKLEELFEKESSSFNGRNSGKNDVLKRANLFKELLKSVIQGHSNG